MAPNIITLFGFVTVLLPGLLFYFTNIYHKLFSAFCVAVYTLADALDGRQARRNRCANILGQLFDHTIDSIAIALIMFYLMGALNLKSHHYAIISTALFQFITAAIIEKHTSEFKLGFINGPSEGIILVVLLNIVSAFKQITVPTKYLDFIIFVFNFYNALELVNVYKEVQNKIEYLNDIFSFLVVIYGGNILKEINFYISICVIVLLNSSLNISILLSHIFECPLSYAGGITTIFYCAENHKMIYLYFAYVILEYCLFIIDITNQLEYILNIKWYSIKK